MGVGCYQLAGIFARGTSPAQRLELYSATSNTVWYARHAFRFEVFNWGRWIYAPLPDLSWIPADSLEVLEFSYRVSGSNLRVKPPVASLSFSWEQLRRGRTNCNVFWLTP